MSTTAFRDTGSTNSASTARRAAGLGRIRCVGVSTGESPMDPVPRGRIVAVETDKGRIFSGVYVTRTICMRVPVSALNGFLLNVPRVRRTVGDT